MSMITARDLSKTYRLFEKEPGLQGSVKSLFRRRFTEKHAVSDLDLSVDEGEFVGLIGPNGAGKTTLVKMLTGIVAPSSGSLDVLGYNPNRLQNAFKKQYAVVMGQKSQLFFELTPADTFRLFGELYDIPRDQFRQNVGYFTELFGVSELMNVQVRTLSLGERMKMELIVALLHDPCILFLDEPTIGLDAVAQRQMRAFLREVNREKHTTILLTSHYMEDVRSLCPRSVVIGGGRKLYDGGTDALFDAYQTHKKITVLYHGEPAYPLPEQAEVLEQSSHKLVLLVPKVQSHRTLEAIMGVGGIQDISVEEEDIGSVVERIYSAGGSRL